MAYIKIFGIKSTVKKAVDYITNPDKTDDQNLVSSYGCSPETADLEFAMTAKLGKDNVMEKGDNLAWHMIISFKPGEITDPNVAHEVATKIADATLKGKHEYVLSTHVDKDHVHCHLIFNATNFVDYHKYVSNKRNYHKICKLSNRICREYGLEESMPTGQKAKSYKENMEHKRGNSWKAKLKYNVDRAIWTSVSFDEFLMKMKEAGYEIRQGKYLAFRAPDQKHFTNVKTLGAYYAEDSILRRLEKNRHKARIPQNASFKVRMFVEMTSYVSDGNRPGFEQWARKNNLKEAARTFSYLSQHNLLNYEEFQNHISDLEASIQAADVQILQTQKAIPSQGTPNPLAPSQAASAISCMVSRNLTHPGRHHSGVSLLVRRFAQKAIAVAMLKCKPLFLFILGPIVLGLIRNPIWQDSGGLASSFSFQGT